MTWLARWLGAPTDYWLTRLVLLRAVAAVYLVAFLIALNQARPLIGERGLLPGAAFHQRVSFWDAPGLFWLNASDAALFGVAVAGVAVASLALLGITEAFGAGVHLAAWLALWVMYLSFVSIGQEFWGFGWETLLLETGFLAVFLGASSQPVPVVVIWMLRWVLFRIMFGAGMIKLRGDPCWRDLTCMNYHYETQPLPNPLSWLFHQEPTWVHKAEVAVTHIIELVIPFGYFAPPPWRYVAGLLTVLFQGMLILSGNLSWLNYVTIVVAISCFDDALFARVLPFASPAGLVPSTWFHSVVIGALAMVVAVLSWRPLANLFDPGQRMNASFEPLHLVNSYGAFGSVTRVRKELVLEATDDPAPGPATRWQAYEFKGKPGTVTRRPPVVSPYHYKIDWQMWFAAMSSYEREPWLLSLVARLLQADPPTLALLAASPFGDQRPRFVRAELYEYHYSQRPGVWWERRRLRAYLPPLALDDPDLQRILLEIGWRE